MNITVSTILTDKDARETATVEESLSQEVSAGIPWFDRA